jgi:hypothetical protein
MKRLGAAALLTGIAMAFAPVVTTPAAHADICANAGGRHFSVSGCGHPGATGVAIASAADPFFPGEVPCYTAEGVPYYTPDGDPC